MRLRRKALSILAVVMLLSATLVSPVSALELGAPIVPKADFQPIWNHVQEMIKTINAGQSVETAKPAPAPVEQKPVPAPVVAKPVPAPVEQKPAPAPVVVKPAPAPVVVKPAPAPVEQKPAPAPVVVKPVPAPVEQKPAPAPVVVKPAPAPVEQKPTPAPVEQKPTPAPETGYTVSAFEKEVVRLVNIEREKEGLKPLVMDTPLCKGARAKSQDMVDNNYFSHTSPKYGSPFDMMKAFGIRYSTAGENIASGQSTPAAVVRAWMNSEGHRKNIMSTKYGKIGVGYAYKSGGSYHHYWTQWFTN